jgi:hypothetical protein
LTDIFGVEAIVVLRICAFADEIRSGSSRVAKTEAIGEANLAAPA